MATLVGKVGMVMKGDWNSSSTYEQLDVVTYSSGLYVAKQNVPANTVPTNTTYWQKAIDGASIITEATDNFGFSVTNSNAANLIVKYLGNRNNFKLIGTFTTDQAILIYAGYPANTGGGTSLRGLYFVDAAGNVSELSNIGGTLPTTSLNGDNTEMTITLPFNYAYLFILSFRPLTFGL